MSVNLNPFLKRGLLASFFLLLFAVELSASRFVFSPNGLLVPTTVDEINAISEEVYEKTNVGIFSAVLSKLPEGETLEGFEDKLIADLPSDYLLIVLVTDIKKIDIKISKSLENEVDINRIYWNYMVPLLPKSDKDMTTKRISAVIFNGYMDAAEQIAEWKGVHIDRLPPPSSETAADIIQYLFYFFAGSLILILIYSYIRGGKES